MVGLIYRYRGPAALVRSFMSLFYDSVKYSLLQLCASFILLGYRYCMKFGAILNLSIVLYMIIFLCAYPAGLLNSCCLVDFLCMLYYYPQMTVLAPSLLILISVSTIIVSARTSSTVVRSSSDQLASCLLFLS